MVKRLFPTIFPQTYTITLQPDLEAYTFTGEEEILLELQKSSKTLTFHAYQLQIEKAELIEDGTTYVPSISYSETAKTVTFSFDKELAKGQKTLRLWFTGILGEKAKGFYRSFYEDNGKKKVMATTQFEEIGARQAFICIDEPAAKAVFDITLTVPQHCTAVTNTKEASVEQLSKGYKKVHFEPTPRMSTYIVAFIVGELEFLEKHTKEGVTVRAYATAGKSALTEFSLDVAVNVLSFFNEYFDTPYPLSKLDLIAIPDFDAGAMENWGAVTFRESILLVDPKRSSAANKQWAALVVAHELAHMWFGNLVTMEWWTHLWLNEGFACYIEYLAVNKLFPEWELWKQFAITEHNEALALDSLQHTHAIEVPIADDQHVKEIFDEISYAKGASVIHMLASFLGEEVFRDGLRFYLKKHAYKNAQTEDLWEALSEISKQPVKDIMQFWTQKPGFPLVTVSEKQQGLSVSQQRFFATPVQVKDTTEWKIPLRFTQPNAKQVPLVIDKKTMDIPSTGEWTKLNSEEAAFVRVIYPPKQYAALGKPIAEKSLGAIDRMGIIRDAFAGAKAGFLSTDQALRLLDSYKQENDYIVWSTIAGYLGAVENIVFEIPGASEKFEIYAREIFTSIAKKMGWETRKGESHTDVLLRSVVLSAAGRYGDPEVIKHARVLFDSYVTTHQEIDANIRGTVFVLVAEHGTQKEWDALVRLYKNEPLQQEKNRLLVALTLFKNPSLIEKTLTFFLSEEVRWQDKSRFIAAVFGNSHGKKLAWECITKNWSLFEKEYKGLHGYTRLIEGIGSFASSTMLAEIESFFTTHPAEELQLTIKQGIERIKANIAWLERDGDKISVFLEKH
jgi:puromycin-sensitive aminopeptidase